MQIYKELQFNSVITDEGKVAQMPQDTHIVEHTCNSSICTCSMKHLGVFLLPPGWGGGGGEGAVLLLVHQSTRKKCQGVLLLPPGWDSRPSQDTQHGVTGTITIPTGWDVRLSQDTQHNVTRNITTPPWMGYLSQYEATALQHRIPSMK